jgi:hypothetical protein
MTLLDYIITSPMDRLRFRDFLRLKCGRDELSRRRLPDLVSAVSAEVAETIRIAFVNEKHQAAALRWHLRGLPVEKAIRKIKTDIEVSENADSRRTVGDSDGDDFAEKMDMLRVLGRR